MRAMIRMGTALVGVVAAMVPAHAAMANPTVGGGTINGGPCDVTVASITFDENGNIEQMTLGDVRCEPFYNPGLPPVPPVPPVPPLPHLG